MSSAASSEEPESFVTVIIKAHGIDLKKVLADPEQKDTLRKLAVAGKCGSVIKDPLGMSESIFYATNTLAADPDSIHMPSDRKLRIVDEYMHNPLFSYPTLLHEAFKKEQPVLFADVKPEQSEWFTATKVSYDHSYTFVSYDEDNQWEREVFGLWFADGSVDARTHAGFNPISESSTYRCDILKQVIDPAILPDKGDFFNFEISMFALATQLKRVYQVKNVNFIDVSCRSYTKPLFQKVADLFSGCGAGVRSPCVDHTLSPPSSPIAQSAQPTTVMFKGGLFEIYPHPVVRGVSPKPLQEGWVYGKDPTGVFGYINTFTNQSVPHYKWTGTPPPPPHPHPRPITPTIVKNKDKDKQNGKQPWKAGGKPRRTFKNKNKRKSKCGKRCKGNNKSMRRSTTKHRRRNKY
jgi:hypothetical protein